MKKIGFILLIILLPATVSSERTHYLKLRASYHTEFLRIVLEGTESLISRGMVNQKGNHIIVRFPHASFTIREEKMPIAHKTDRDTILFSPGHFSGFKVFSLKYPSRLVIDVYLEPKKRDVKRTIDALREKLKKSAKPLIKSKGPRKTAKKLGIKTVVIDPGHGGYESGLVSGKYREKNVVLDIAKKLKVLINRGSARGLLTRKSDLSMTLGERVEFTNNRNAEIFLSFHIGDHDNFVLYTPVITDPVPYEVKDFLLNKGQEDFVVKSEILRNAMQEAIAEDFGNDMVLTKPLPYSILSRIEAAALIIELPSFEDAYYIAELKTELANTIYKGLYLYEENTAN